MNIQTIDFTNIIKRVLDICAETSKHPMTQDAQGYIKPIRGLNVPNLISLKYSPTDVSGKAYFAIKGYWGECENAFSANGYDFSAYIDPLDNRILPNGIRRVELGEMKDGGGDAWFKVDYPFPGVDYTVMYVFEADLSVSKKFTLNFDEASCFITNHDDFEGSVMVPFKLNIEFVPDADEGLVNTCELNPFMTGRLQEWAISEYGQ